MDKQLSAAKAHYLRHLWMMGQGGGVRLIDLAVDMGVTKPSACNAVQALEAMGYVRRDAARKVWLTEAGKLESARLAKRYEELAGAFCAAGLAADKAVCCACALEHVLDGEEVERLTEGLKGIKGRAACAGPLPGVK